MKIKLNQDLGGMKAGNIVHVATDAFGNPLSMYWRRRLKDNVDGKVFEVLADKPKKNSKSKNSNPEKDNSKEKG